MRLSTSAVLVLLVSCTLAPGRSLVAQEERQRPLTPADLFRMEQLSVYLTRPAAFSPDGSMVAWVRVRAEETAAFHNHPYLSGNDRADIWVASTEGGEPVNVTEGATDGWGYWAPRWSSDGEFLAMYGTDGEGVYACAWNREERKVLRMGDGGMDILTTGPVWRSPRELVAPGMPPGEKPLMMHVLRKTPDVAMRAWPKNRAGKEATASILDSGVPTDLSQEPQGRLLLFDVASGESRVLHDGDVFDPVAAPGGNRLSALVRVDTVHADPDQPLRHRPDHGVYELRLFDRDGIRPAGELEGLRPVIRRAVYWSPDGSRLAFAADNQDEDATSRAEIAVVDPTSGAVERYSTEGLDPFAKTILFLPPPLVRWTSGGELLLQARSDSERMDWWLLDRSERPRNLTASLEEVPDDLFLEKAEDSFVGIADGDVWRIPAGDGEPINLTDDFPGKIASFVWKGTDDDPTTGIEEVVVQVEDEEDSDGDSLHRMVLASKTLSPIPTPATGAELIAASSPGEWLAFREDDRDGLVLWLSRSGAEGGRALFETNTFLRGIEEAETRLVEYESLEGQELTGWLLLPIGYEEGKTYPMVTWVYAGSMARRKPRSLMNLNMAHALNQQLLAARGYAVLAPSMPLKVQGEASDPYMELTTGVLPAIDRVVELGIVDPDRVAVMGQSYGGYSTMGLITQTNRFKAAISLAGLSNLVSVYGQFTGRGRYADDVHEDLFGLSICETGQLSMGSPPWVDMQRYIRNSPISYVHRVETPLLIIQGDLDYVAIQQGEEFFMSLLRQNKRARFARYWGEGHVFHSPANVEHMWGQIHAWLDEHLAEEPGEETSPSEGK